MTRTYRTLSKALSRKRVSWKQAEATPEASRSTSASSTGWRSTGRSRSLSGVLAVFAFGLLPLTPLEVRAEPPLDLRTGDVRTAPPVVACSERLEPHEIGPRLFVLDAVTRCAIVPPERAPVRATLEGDVAALESEADAAAVCALPEPGATRVAASPPSERVPRWSGDRRRLSNTQFIRSVAALSDRFARGAR